MKEIVTLSGDIGGGKSSVARILKETLGFQLISAGGIQREIAASCGAELPLEEVTALRDFWTRFHCQGQDWDAVQRRLLSLATRYRPPRPVKNLRTQLRSSISFGWLANTIRASRLRDVTLFCGHLRRAREAAGARFPLVWMRFVRELAAVGGNADRLT